MKLAIAPLRSTPAICDVGDLAYALSQAVRVIEQANSFVMGMSSDQPGLASFAEAMSQASENPIIAEMLESDLLDDPQSLIETQHTISLPLIVNDDAELESTVGY
jgi:hypothetical protein